MRPEGASLSLEIDIGNSLFSLSLLTGEHNLNVLFLNHVNAYYEPEQYEILAQQIIKSMAEGGEVHIQWTTEAEKPNDPGPLGKEGSRGHITGSDLVEALNKLGRSFDIIEKTPILDYEYSVEPSTVIGNEPGTEYDKKGTTPPRPQYYWVIKFN